jgi:hypothetical protein
VGASISERDVIPYLLGRGLVGSKSVVEGDVLVTNASRRHRSYSVVSDHGSCYLLKVGTDDERRATLEREAAAYRRLQAEPSLAPFLVHFYEYDAIESVLIVEFLRHGQDLRKYQFDRVRFSTLHGRALGRILGILHSRTAGTTNLAADGSSLPLWAPWILTVHRPTVGLYLQASGASLELIKILQRFPEFAECLDRLRDAWSRRAVIHGDIKADNCVVVARPESTSTSSRKTRLKVVDWESAEIGDPRWDVGSVFGDYLGSWVLSIPVSGDTPPERFLEFARFPLERMHPALEAFWRVYLEEAGISSESEGEMLVESVRFAGARLLQTAFEQAQTSPALTGHAICTIQLALNVLQRPHEASAQLLGLSAFV